MNDVSRNIARLVFKYRWEELSDGNRGNWMVGFGNIRNIG